MTLLNGFSQLLIDCITRDHLVSIIWRNGYGKIGSRHPTSMFACLLQKKSFLYFRKAYGKVVVFFKTFLQDDAFYMISIRLSSEGCISKGPFLPYDQRLREQCDHQLPIEL